MAEMTVEQQQALALAGARLRLQQQTPASAPSGGIPVGRATPGMFD
jgi:hypothetical protein